MKFSLISLVTGTVVAALTLASISGGGHTYWGAGLRIALLLSFLTSVLFAVYSKSHSKDFSLGWAICGGTTLGLIFCQVPLIATPVEHAVRRANPLTDFQGYSLDLAFSAVAAYLGGSLAVALRRREQPERTSAPTD